MLSIFVFFFFAFLAADVGSAAGYFRIHMCVFRFKGPLPADVLDAYMWERNEGKCVGCGITFALDAPPSVVVLVRLVLRSDGAGVESRRPLEGAENTPFTWYTRNPLT